jgi:hypothetical protein
MRDSRLTRRIKKKIASETAARLAAQPLAQNNAACSLSPMEGRRALPEKIAGSAVISHQQATLKKKSISQPPIACPFTRYDVTRFTHWASHGHGG